VAKRWANYYTQEKLLDAIGTPPQALVDAVDQMLAELAPGNGPAARPAPSGIR
jgi:hypothetical protein